MLSLDLKRIFSFKISILFYLVFSYPSVSTCLPIGSYQESFPPFQGESVIINSIITIYICSSNDCKIKLGDLQKGFPCDSNGKQSAYNQETQIQSLGGEDPLEKEMTTHSSTLAWKIPWTEEPSRLQSMGSQRVR